MKSYTVREGENIYDRYTVIVKRRAPYSYSRACPKEIFYRRITKLDLGRPSDTRSIYVLIGCLITRKVIVNCNLTTQKTFAKLKSLSMFLLIWYLCTS